MELVVKLVVVKDRELARQTNVWRHYPLVGLEVLLEVILPPERFVTAGDVTGEGLDPGVDPLVPGQLLVPGE